MLHLSSPLAAVVSEIKMLFSLELCLSALAFCRQGVLSLGPAVSELFGFPGSASLLWEFPFQVRLCLCSIPRL